MWREVYMLSTFIKCENRYSFNFLLHTFFFFRLSDPSELKENSHKAHITNQDKLNKATLMKPQWIHTEHPPVLSTTKTNKQTNKQTRKQSYSPKFQQPNCSSQYPMESIRSQHLDLPQPSAVIGCLGEQIWDGAKLPYQFLCGVRICVSPSLWP